VDEAQCSFWSTLFPLDVVIPIALFVAFCANQIDPDREALSEYSSDDVVADARLQALGLA
jgi:hypothetical protein